MLTVNESKMSFLAHIKISLVCTVSLLVRQNLMTPVVLFQGRQAPLFTSPVDSAAESPTSHTVTTIKATARVKVEVRTPVQQCKNITF